MRVVIFGGTGLLGQECVTESLAAGHDVTVLARSPDKISENVRSQVTVVEGDALDETAVSRVLDNGAEAVLFAIGIDRNSPEDLCTDATRHILRAMSEKGVERFIWCGGGSNLVQGDVVTMGARFVAFFASTFMGLRHRDKTHQLDLLKTTQVKWLGVRPLQMKAGKRTGQYRLGFNAFSGLSQISAADCAHAMVGMLTDDTWLGKAPIIQY